MSANNALERLFDSNNQEESNYSLEEQMDSASNDEFLEGMSSAAERALINSVTEVTLDEPEEKEEIEDTTIKEETVDNKEDEIVVSKPIENDSSKETDDSKEELFNNNTEEKKQRKKRAYTKNTESTKDSSNSVFIPIMDQLAKDIVDDLKKSGYKINRFDKQQMNIVLDYMYEKF